MNAIRYLSLIIVFLNTFFTAQAKYEFLLNKPYGERSALMDSIFYYNVLRWPDSTAAFAEINELENEAGIASDKELFLEAKALKYDYYITGSHDFTRFEARMRSVLQEIEKKGITQLEIRVRQSFGYYYFFKTHNYVLAFENYLRSYELMKSISIKDFPAKQEHIYNIAFAYYYFGDYENATKYLSEAEKVPASYNARITINIYNTQGVIYQNEGKYDSAYSYFMKAYKIADAKNDLLWQGIAQGNLGANLLLQKKYNEAIPYLDTAVKICLFYNELDNVANFAIKLGEIYLFRKDLKNAKEKLWLARGIINNTADKYSYESLLFPLMAKYNELQGNMLLAYHYSDSAIIAKDNQNKEKSSLILARAQQNVEKENYALKEHELKDQKSLHMLTRNFFIGGIILIAIIAILFINRQNLKNNHLATEKKIAEMQKLYAEAGLAEAQSQLEKFTTHIHEKNEQLDKIYKEIEDYKLLTESNKIDNNKEVLYQLQQSTILTDDQWKEFRFLFDKVYKGFLDRLNEKHPNLSPAETRFIALSKLKISSKEMAGMLGVGTDTIRQHKSRLRRKLNLSEEVDLSELIEQI